MELISNLFGNLASGLIRLAVAVGIIAATYFFLVKPVLHTTDNAINRSFGPGGIGGIQRQIDHAINSANGQVQHAVRRPSTSRSAEAGTTPRSCCAACSGPTGTSTGCIRALRVLPAGQGRRPVCANRF